MEADGAPTAMELVARHKKEQEELKEGMEYVVVWQHERKYAGLKGWKKPSQDDGVPAWADEDGMPSMKPSELTEQELTVDWKWAPDQDWTIWTEWHGRKEVDNKTDSNGWQYAPDFPNDDMPEEQRERVWRPVPPTGLKRGQGPVRRRKHSRLKLKKTQEDHMGGEKQEQGGCATCCGGCCARCCGDDDEEAVMLRRREEQERRRKKNEQKTFYYKIDRITAVLEDKRVQDAFIEIEVGGNLIEVPDNESPVRTSKKKKVRKKNARGKMEMVEVEVDELEYPNKIQVVKNPAARVFTQGVAGIVAKQSVSFPGSFKGEWKGTYANLAFENVTVRMWMRRPLSANVLIGEATQTLKDIADGGKMDRQFKIYKFSEHSFGVPREHNIHAEVAATVRLKCELQEKYRFKVSFCDWELSEEVKDLGTKHPLCCYRGNETKFGTVHPTQGGRLMFQVSRGRELWGDWFKRIFCARKNKHRDWDTLDIDPLGRAKPNKFANLAYPGTRAWMEEEDLTLVLKQRVSCIPACCWHLWPTVAERTIALQGRPDYGYISTHLGPPARNKRRNGNYQQLGEDLNAKGGISVDQPWKNKPPVPLYKQQGNSDPARAGLFTKSESNFTFLVVQVVRAKGLYSLRGNQADTLNPSVSLDWNKIRKETRVMNRTSQPYFSDDIFFKIRDQADDGKPKKFEDFNQQVQNSIVTLTVWNNRGLDREPLGYAHVPFARIYNERKRQRIKSLASEGAEVMRWVWHIPRLLLMEPLTYAEHVTDKGLSAEGADGSGAEGVEARFVELKIYFDRSDRHNIRVQKTTALEVALKEGARKPAGEGSLELPPLGETGIALAQSFWDITLQNVKAKGRRSFSFYGMDEYTGRLFYLPTFIHPMPPPTEVRDLSKLLYFCYSIQLINKPYGLMKSDSPHADLLSDVWAWADPYWTLDKRKGSVRDTALLLCSFLSGIQHPYLDAYVCIGSARTRRPGGKPGGRGASEEEDRPVPHVWVMTLETGNIHLPPQSAADEIRLDAERREKTAHKKNQKQKPPVRRVRFWEVTNGETYTLQGDRFKELPVVKTEEEEEREERERAGEGDDGAAAGADEDKDEGKKKFWARKRGGGKASAGSEQNVKVHRGEGGDDDSAEDSLGEWEERKHASDSDSELGRGEGAERGGNRRDIEWEPALQEAAGKQELSAMELLKLSLGTQLEDTEKLDQARGYHRDLAYSTQTEVKETRVEVGRQTAKLRRELLAQLADPELKRRQEELLKENLHQTPYRSIDVVFNAQRIYANLQDSDPELIQYQLDAPERWVAFKEKHWRKFFPEYRKRDKETNEPKIPHLHSFFGNKALNAFKSNATDTAEVRADIVEQAKASIVTHRSYERSWSTNWLTPLSFQLADNQDFNGFLRRRLAHEEMYGLKDADLYLEEQNTQNASPDNPAFDNEGDGEDSDQGINSEGRKAPWRMPDYMKTWSNTLHQSLEEDEEYSLKLLHFKHSDPNRICDMILSKCNSMIQIRDEQEPRYAVAAHITQLPASISPVRLLILCIYKTANA